MAQVLQFPKWEPIDHARVEAHYAKCWWVIFHCCAIGMWAHPLVYQLMYKELERMMLGHE